MSHSDTLAVGVIGTGGMGARHALNLHRAIGAARVSAVYDVDAARAAAVAVQCGGAAVLSDPLALIASDAVDALVIASPDDSHAEFVLACLRQGKPVLCEKPLTARLPEAERVIAAELALGRRLISVGFMRRFDPQHLAVRQAVESGAIGRALLFKGVHRNARVWPHATGASILANSGGHDIDSLRWLLGHEVTEAYVSGLRTRASFSDATRDLLLVQLALGGACLATIEVYVAAEYGYEVSAEVVGERGSATTLPPGDALIRARAALATDVPPDWLVRFQAAYLAELAEWVEALRAARPFAGASAWDGYMSLLVADACAQSLHAGAPVAVPTPARPALYEAG